MNISKDYDEISIDELKSIFEKQINTTFSVLCVSEDGTTAMVPIANAGMIFTSSECNCKCSAVFSPKTTKYFIKKTLKKHFHGQNEFYKMVYSEESHGKSKLEINKWFRSKFDLFNSMSTLEKENYFIDLHNALIYDTKRANPDTEYNSKIIDILFDTGALMEVIAGDLVNKDRPSTYEERKEYHVMVNLYQKLVYDINRTVIKHITQHRKGTTCLKDFRSNPLLQMSSPLSHALRVFIMYTDFLLYYNEVFNQGLVQKIRKGFGLYQDYYNRVFTETFKNKKTIEKLEDVFKNSMQAIQTKELEQYTLASSVHDIGKFFDMDYYVNEKGYDEKRIQKHLFSSFYMINRDNQPLNTIYTVAFHHEYYGLGYGLFNFMLQTKKNQSQHFYSSNVISYDIHDVLNCESIAFFSAKMLEIVDVYDRIMHPWFEEQELKSSTPEGVLDLMRTNYIKKEVKLDPILFDIFVSYLENMHQINFYEYKTWNTNY